MFRLTPLFRSRLSEIVGAGVAIAFAGHAAGAMAGTLTIPGTGDGIEILNAVGAAYTADNPNTVVIVPPSIGSGGAIVAVTGDREVLGRVARPLSEAEKAQGLVFTPIVKIPSAIFVHPSVKLDSLTAKQVADIYSGAVSNWSELGGPDLRIKVVRREDADSTLGVLRASMPYWKDLVLTPKSKTATTTQEAIETTRQTEGSIGFAPYSPALQPSVTVLKIDGKFPTDEGYPSAVTLALIHKPGTVTPEATNFVRFANSAKARQLVTNLGGVPLGQ
ncbi:substrate-binding domain-containing protein [Alsobacter sp. SYSU M60028]|uniref:Substrate-binding domain-containing protein n=1 Tax=Alsobacter ponti TaxID=2962936 RepID=A0ABT1LHZ4_9HYPH|nr:substrate-binding domain-containing protein [Alsobacter ponti]MCP8940581.1 substrate-binding domain-containing protein [Alsobacter ponti]